jgi:hypothetical protein
VSEEAMDNQDDNAAWDRAIDRKASALRVLGPLGFEDADDGETPGAIWHRNSSVTLDCAITSPAHVVEALLSIGREQGRNEVRAQMRAAIGL